MTDTERSEWIAEYNTLGGPNAFELEVIRLINELRAERGLVTLEVNMRLMAATRFYTQTKANLGLPLGHGEGPYGGSGATAAAFGSSWSGANGAWGGSTPQAVVDMWMNSDGHRYNMLNPYHRSIGIGANNPFVYMLATGEAAPALQEVPVPNVWLDANDLDTISIGGVTMVTVDILSDFGITADHSYDPRYRRFSVGDMWFGIEEGANYFWVWRQQPDGQPGFGFGTRHISFDSPATFHGGMLYIPLNSVPRIVTGTQRPYDIGIR